VQREFPALGHAGSDRGQVHVTLRPKARGGITITAAV